MSSIDHSRLEDIRVYGAQALDLVKPLTPETFLQNIAVRLAVLHCLTLVGEAANQISAPTRNQLQTIPWAKVVGLRNVIVHHYRKVDLSEIWTIVTRDLPPVVEAVRDFLKDEP